MKLALFAFLGTLALTSTPAAQLVVGEFDQNPLPVGGTVTFTITDAGGSGFQLPTTCGDIRIYEGSQTGPQVGHNMICGAALTPVAAGGSYSFTWTMNDFFGFALPPGDYWWRSSVFDANLNPVVDWYCLRVQDTGPALTLGGTPQVGTSAPFSITGGPGGAFYFVALSRTMNQPVSLPGPFQPAPLDLCLSLDALFDISINDPFSVMTASFGFLDAAGAGAGSVDVPPIATLSMEPFQMQAILVDGFGTWSTTNGLSSWVRP